MTRLSIAVLHARALVAAAQEACATASAISVRSAEIVRACQDLRLGPGFRQDRPR